MAAAWRRNVCWALALIRSSRSRYDERHFYQESFDPLQRRGREFCCWGLQAKLRRSMRMICRNPAINEGVDHAWYEYPDQMKSALHPWEGVTKAKYTGPKEGTATIGRPG
jgi:Ni,Fe-hydrogenase I large subunit